MSDADGPRPVTLLFTDIEGSTRLLGRLGDSDYAVVLDTHERLLRAVFSAHGGEEIANQGDGFFVAFAGPSGAVPSALGAILAAIECQRALRAQPWPPDGEVRVRMGIHTGIPNRVGDTYVGLDVHRAARLCAAGHGEQILISGPTRDLVADALWNDITLRPLGEFHLRDLPQSEPIFQLLVPDLPSEFPPLRALDARFYNLPVQRTSFIGREQDVAAVRQILLREDAGLVTLTGPAGTGKTRLAIAVASNVADSFPDGVCFVALAPIGEPELVASVMVRTLGLQEAGPASPEETLRAYLRDRQMLLVLDNFEHLLAAAPLVGDLMTTCPRLKILATSRANLRLYGEQDVPVQPLALPDPDRVSADEDLEQYSAIALFSQRATAIKADFSLTPENRMAVAAICQRLDGLPLATELAAARVGLLTPQAMLTRLQSAETHASLDLLTTGPRDMPARHQTLRDAIGWSYSLLDTEMQALFRRLAIFVGGFSLHAAAAVAGPDGNWSNPDWGSAAALPDVPLAILDGVASLTENSLLQQRTDGPGGEPRFSMLETIREYGLERLTVQDELDTMRRRHAAYFLALAEEGDRQAGGPHQAEWLGRLDDEHANLRAALAWSLVPNSPDAQLGLRLASALWVFWFRRAYLHEGSRWMQQALAVNPNASPLYRARLLTGDGSFARMRGDFPKAEELLEAGASLYRDLGDAEGLAWSLSHLGLVKQWLGHLDEGVDLLEESLTLRRTLGDDRGIARSLFNLAVAEDFRRDYERAGERYAETLEVQRRVGDIWGIGRVMGYLAKVMLLRGQVDRAEALCEEGINLSREVGDNWGVGLALAGLGGVAWARGDLERGASLLKESLVTFRDVGSRDRVAECLQDLASLACIQGALPQAVRLSAAAEATQQRIGLALWPAVRARRDQDLANARSGLGEQAFNQAWAAGLPMSIEQAIDDALTVPARP